jgi:hypothetical protein
MSILKETTKTLKTNNNFNNHANSNMKATMKISPLTKHLRFIDENDNDNNNNEKYDCVDNFEDFYFKTNAENNNNQEENSRQLQISVNGRGLGLVLPKVFYFFNYRI